MRYARHVAWALAILLVPVLARGADPKLGETLAELKKAQEAAWAALDEGRKEGTPEAEKEKAVARYYESMKGLGQRAVAFADAHPETPEAVEVLVWAHDVASSNDPEFGNTIYRALAESYLDSDTILPICRLAWNDAVSETEAEGFLRAAVERSKNLKVRSLCCYSLGRHQQQVARMARYLRDPVAGKFLERNIAHYGPAATDRLRKADPEALEREAEGYFERTIREFGTLQPMGKNFAPLGEQARGMLFRMHHLEIGRKVPEIEGEDIDGKPLKLSDYQGKVVLVSFWATWCGPCMGLVPHEKTLVETMKGRPFALVGVNGDMDRDEAKTVSKREGIAWRSFWNGGPMQGIPVRWGVSSWPTIFVIDAKGVIRDDGIVYFNELYQDGTPNRAIERLVAEAEAEAAESR